MESSSKKHSNNNKLLENMDTLLNYIETSRKDMLGATKSVVTAYKNELEQSKSLEDNVEKLRVSNKELELARDKVEHDLLRLREAYQKEVARNQQLTLTVETLQSKLKQSSCEATSGQHEQTDKSGEDQIPPQSQGNVSEEREEGPASSSFVSPEHSSCTGLGSTRASLSSSTSYRHLKSSTLPYSVPSKSVSTKSTSQSGTPLAKKCSSSKAEHSMCEQSKLCFQTCHVCKGSILPLTKYYQCGKCGLKVDPNCAETNSMPCVLSKASTLRQLISTERQWAVPDIVLECCEQIEQRGKHCDELYSDQKQGQEASKLLGKYLATKNVTQLKLRKVEVSTQSPLNEHKIPPLDQPLIGSEAWQDFARASDQKSTDERNQLLRQLVSQMSKSYRHTLAFLLLHLKQVSVQNFHSNLDKSSVAALFGPIIAGNAHEQGRMNAQDQIKRVQLQKQIVLALLDLPTEYYEEALNDQRESVVYEPKRRTTNYQMVLMNDQQRQSFYHNLSNSMY